MKGFLNYCKIKKIVLPALFIVIPFLSYSQSDSIKQQTIPVNPAPVHEKKWYETFSIRGYTQIRYNRLLETNENLGCEQCDRSWGKNGGFIIRRLRIIFYGQINKQIFFYIQPDFATSPSPDKMNFAQIRDAYIDVGLNKDNEFRFRIGQSKVPFGFDNIQSSQTRLPLDRSDALNSAVANERDIGVFFYWAPKKIRALFSDLVKSGLKGSGDYGVVGIGAYNGQTSNSPELNDKLHTVARISYPFKYKNQIIEAGIQAYSGKYVISPSNLSAGVKYINDLNYTDERVAASFILYPKPFGIQAEYNIGKGPEFNKLTDSIEVKNLKGGYVTLNYQIPFKSHLIIPFTRFQYYDGGKKHEKDARSYNVKEMEFGVEWQPVKQFEMVVMYTISKRRYEDFTLRDNLQKGNLLRVQIQFNY